MSEAQVTKCKVPKLRVLHVLVIAIVIVWRSLMMLVMCGEV